MVRDHYLLLGIPRDAGQRQIKSVYRSLAKRFHPDRNKGSETAAELFRQINQAYRVLSDPALRAQYDRQLERCRSTGEQQASSAAGDRSGPSKFKKFLDSLLDAILAPEEEETLHRQTRCRTERRSGQTAAQRPDFNFYYHLAMEKREGAYTCGKDGIYRRQRKRAKPLRH